MVVNCAGQWAKALGDLVGVTVPLHSCEHFYVVTEAVEGTHPDLPIMRDPDGWTYFKEEVGGLVVGGFEPEAKPWRSPDDLPYPFEFQLLDEDWEHFSVLMDEALLRIPALAETGIRKFYNGPESFTPDNQFLLGRAPELDDFFVGAGFNSVGIASAGGAGRALAEWVVAGEPQDDLAGVDVRRFAPFARRQPAGCAPGSRRSSACTTPCRGPTASSRPRATSARLAAARAAGRGGRGLRHQEWAGSGRTSSAGRRGARLLLGQAVLAGRWSAAEQRATPRRRSRSSTRPRSPSTSSPARARSRRCSGSAPPTSTCRSGTCVYTPWLNERGTYEADLTVTRDGPDSFLLVSSLGHDGARPRLAAPAGRRRGAATSPTRYAVLGRDGAGSRRC